MNKASYAKLRYRWDYTKNEWLSQYFFIQRDYMNSIMGKDEISYYTSLSKAEPNVDENICVKYSDLCVNSLHICRH